MTLDIAIVYNRSNGLVKDAKLLDSALKEAARVAGEPMGKVRHLDPREVPVMCDVIIHLEIPYYGWMPYARYNIMMVNPEWWVPEAFDSYLKAFDMILFKNESVKDLFSVVCQLEDSKYEVVPWCSEAISPTHSDAQPPVREFLYLVGGSTNKAAAAKELVSIWKVSYPALHIYTPRNDFVFGEEVHPNVHVIRKELEANEIVALQRRYFGHCCLSEAEGFGLSAAESEAVGAFTLLNHNDAYDATYSGDNYVQFLPSIVESNDRVRSSKFKLDLSGSQVVLDSIMPVFLSQDISTCINSRRLLSDTRRSKFKRSIANVFKKVLTGVSASHEVNKTRHIPPGLSKKECPPISVITLIYNRRKFWDLALHNMMITDYPRDKLEWVIVDDSDDMAESISDNITKIQKVLPGLNVVYVPWHEKLTIGGKRNLGVKRSTHDIILMMDDDDHYPETSFRRRTAYLVKNPTKGCAVCSSIALYDLRTGISAVNVPPFGLPLGKRISEATLTFRRSFYLDRKFEKISMAEGDSFIQGRESEVVEMMPQQIIVSFCHGSNSSSRRIPPSDVKPGCFWGFPSEFLIFIHKLAGVEVELQNAPSSSSSRRR